MKVCVGVRGCKKTKTKLGQSHGWWGMWPVVQSIRFHLTFVKASKIGVLRDFRRGTALRKVIFCVFEWKMFAWKCRGFLCLSGYLLGRWGLRMFYRCFENCRLKSSSRNETEKLHSMLLKDWMAFVCRKRLKRWQSGLKAVSGTADCGTTSGIIWELERLASTNWILVSFDKNRNFSLNWSFFNPSERWKGNKTLWKVEHVCYCNWKW